MNKSEKTFTVKGFPVVLIFIAPWIIGWITILRWLV